MDTANLRYMRLTENIIGFYDGRVPGQRFAPGPNWVDDGAISLGICSYALIDGKDAIVYDTHVSVEHARKIRKTVETLGARNIAVVLSHHHLDHVAGTEAFADCEIVANRLTADLLKQKQAAIEAGTLEGPPAIKPLILPTTLFEGKTHVHCGGLHLDLIQCDIHSRDGTVIHLRREGILLAGDTLEDTVTYVAEPEGLAGHLPELDRLWDLQVDRIFPNHGDPMMIENGGYRKNFIRATQQYIRALLRMQNDEAMRAAPLREVIAGPLQAGWLSYFEPYEAIHAKNLAAVLGAVSDHA
jgi:cyclase